MADRVANHTLQDDTFWMDHTRITDMESTHIVNCLRMFERSPLGTLWGVKQRAQHDEILADSFSDDGWGYSETLVPKKVTAILEMLQERRRYDRLVELNDDEFEDLPFVKEPPTVEELEAKALRWIRKQPTYRAMKRELFKRLLAGRAHVYSTPTTHRPSAPPIPRSSDD